jgi:Diacylglycerol kinase accessory domain
VTWHIQCWDQFFSLWMSLNNSLLVWRRCVRHCLLIVCSCRVEIPTGLKGLVILNLPTYAGGMNLWGTSKHERFYVPSMADGLLEVIGMKSAAHFV